MKKILLFITVMYLAFSAPNAFARNYANSPYADLPLVNDLKEIQIKMTRGDGTEEGCDYGGRCEKWDTRIGKCSPPSSNSYWKEDSTVASLCYENYKSTCTSCSGYGEERVCTSYTCTKTRYTSGTLTKHHRDYGWHLPAGGGVENLFYKEHYTAVCPSPYSVRNSRVPKPKIEPEGLNPRCYSTVDDTGYAAANRVPPDNEEMLCTMTQNLAAKSIVEHVEGPYGLVSCGENCVTLTVGRDANNYWTGWCDVFEETTSVRIPHPEAIIHANLSHAVFDDDMHIYIKKRQEGVSHLVWYSTHVLPDSRNEEWLRNNLNWAMVESFDFPYLTFKVQQCDFIEQIGGYRECGSWSYKPVTVNVLEMPRNWLKRQFLRKENVPWKSGQPSPYGVYYERNILARNGNPYCEHSTSWRMRPNADITYAFKTFLPNEIIDFNIKTSVSGSGEGYGKIEIHYDPRLIIKDVEPDTGNWKDDRCASMALAIGKGVEAGRLSCTKAADGYYNGCAQVGGMMLCENQMEVFIPTISPLCVEAQVYGDPEAFKKY